MEKINMVFHPRYYNSRYAIDPAAASGRLEGIMEIIERRKDRYDIITPETASEEDILRAHSRGHLAHIQEDPLLYELASLAAGGAIKAAELAWDGGPSFAVIRPPGHHASESSCWGFCYFNNISVSLLKLFADGKIKSAFVYDFDLHTGDGNINILSERDDGFRVDILNPHAASRQEYIEESDRYMQGLENIDIFVASAGFDQGADDWGGLLWPEDYTELGKLMKEHSERLCGGRRYALLEGGYNHDVIGMNVDSFCDGFA